MTRVRVSKEAANFVRNEAAYLRRRNRHAAQSFLNTIRRAKDVLSTFDEAGNMMHGLNIDGGRTLVVDAYLFDYTREQDTVNILAVRHGRMPQVTPDVEDDFDTSAKSKK